MKEAYDPDSLRSRLSGRLHTDDLQELAYYAQGIEDEPVKQTLYRLLFDKDKRVADNAAWVFNYLDLYSNQWLYDKRHELMNEAMQTGSDTKRRLLLALLLRQPFGKDDLRADFLDFCLHTAMSASQPVAVRVLSLKLAYVQCRFFPELLAELRATLEWMDSSLLPAALRTTRKNILARLMREL